MSQFGPEILSKLRSIAAAVAREGGIIGTSEKLGAATGPVRRAIALEKADQLSNLGSTIASRGVEAMQTSKKILDLANKSRSSVGWAENIVQAGHNLHAADDFADMLEPLLGDTLREVPPKKWYDPVSGTLADNAIALAPLLKARRMALKEADSFALRAWDEAQGLSTGHKVKAAMGTNSLAGLGASQALAEEQLKWLVRRLQVSRGRWKPRA